MKTLKRLRHYVGVTIASLLILLALLGLCVEIATPILNTYKGTIEAQISQKIPYKVHIGHISVGFGWYGPKLSLHDVRLSQKSESFVHIQTLSVYCEWLKSLWHHRLYFRSIVISGSQLLLAQVDETHYQVNHMFTLDFSHQGKTSQQQGFLFWLLFQHGIHLENLSLTVKRLSHKATQWQLHNMDMIEDVYGQHRLRAEIANASISTYPLQVFINFSKPFSSPKTVSATGWVAGKRIQLATLQHFVDLPFAIHSGQLDTHITFDIQHGRFSQVKAQSHWDHVQMSNAITTFRLFSATSTLAWQRQSEGWQLSGKGEKIIGDHHAWDTTTFLLAKRKNEMYFQTDYLDLASISKGLQLSSVLSKPQQKMLNQMHIQGALHQVTLHLPLAGEAWKHSQFTAQLSDFGMSAYANIPGVSHLAGDVKGGVRSADFMLEMAHGAITAPHIMGAPIPVETGQFRGHWQWQQKQLLVTVSDAKLNNPEATLSSTLELTVPLDQPAKKTSMDLVGQFSVQGTNHLKTYLPIQLFNHETQAWLDKALLSDQSQIQGKVQIKGKLEDFPFAKPHTGVFLLDSQLSNVQLHYAEDWPDATITNGRLLFNADTIAATIDQAKTQDIPIDHAQLTIKPLGKPGAAIALTLHSQQSAEQATHYIAHSPLEKTLGSWLAPFDVHGVLGLDLSVHVPLAEVSKTTTKGTVVLKDNQFGLASSDMVLTHATGNLHFDQSHLQSDHLSARVGNSPVNITISTLQHDTQDTGMINVLFDGAVTKRDLASFTHQPSLSGWLEGRTLYHGYVMVPFGQKSATIHSGLKSDLKGMAVHLPKPFAKLAVEQKPLEVTMDFKSKTAPIKFFMQYGQALSAKGYYAGESQLNHASLSADIKLSALTWPIFPSESQNMGTQPFDWHIIKHVKLTTPSLQLYGMPLRQVTLTTTHTQPDKIQLAIDAEQAKGQIDIVQKPQEKVTANFDYLVLDTLPVSHKQTKVIDVSAIPGLAIKIKRLTYQDHFYGQLVLATTPMTQGVKITQIDLGDERYHFKATGSWQQLTHSNTTALKGEFATKNLTNLAKSLNVFNALQAKKASSSFDVVWPSAPYQFSLNTLTGTAVISVEDGVIPMNQQSVIFGVSKVLSLFSVESIERRLHLNFSDLSESGYSFNNLLASVRLAQGDAYLSSSYLNGPQAKIDIEGRIGLKQQDYDATLTVNPHVSATIPIIATIAGGPVAGVAAYAVDKLVDTGVKTVNGNTYLLTGSWDNPKLTNMNDLRKRQGRTKRAVASDENTAIISSK